MGTAAPASHKLGPRQLVLARDYLEAPASPWTRRTARVTRAALHRVEETEISGTHIVTIVHDGGKLALSNRTVGDEGYAATKAWLARDAAGKPD